MSAYYSEFDPQAAAWLRELIKAGHLPPGDVDERDIRDVVPADLAGYRQHHFFCGVGGWPHALRLAGWPDDRPVWTGSCPCQPFSSAGKRKGVGDERHLWPDFFRLIEACRPPVVFGEQVASAEVVGTEPEAAFVVAVRRGDFARANKLAKRLAQSGSFHFHRRWLDGVRADLEGAGYAFGSSVLGAHSAGAPHIRQRLYWVADAGPQRRERRAGAGRPGGKATTERCQGVPDAERSGDAGPALGVFHPESHGREQRRAGAGGPAGGDAGFWSSAVLLPCRDGKLRRVEPGIFPLADGVPGRVGLLRGYGNAIVPQVAAEFVRAWLGVTGEG